MSISFPLSIEVQLARASVMTKAWSRGADIVWPDERVELTSSNAIKMDFQCSCGKTFFRKIVIREKGRGGWFPNVKRICPECRQKKYNQELADLRENNRKKLLTSCQLIFNKN